MEHLYDANKWSLWEKQLLQMISCGREIDGQDVDCRRDGLAGRRILPVGTSRCLPLPCHHCRPDGAGGGTYCQTANHSLSSVDAGNAHCNQPPPYHVTGWKVSISIYYWIWRLPLIVLMSYSLSKEQVFNRSGPRLHVKIRSIYRNDTSKHSHF